MAVKKQIKKENTNFKDIREAEKKVKDFLTASNLEKAAFKAMDLLILAGGELAKFYGGGKITDLKALMKFLGTLKVTEKADFVKDFLEIESFRRKSEISGQKMEPNECQKIVSASERFYGWVQKMLPTFSEELEF